MKFRYLETSFHNASWNMALDEAILESVGAEKVSPTLRFYAWKPAAVSIGYFQGINDEVDVEACRLRDVDVVRRVTGGGAVFHSQELTYSLVMPENYGFASGDILSSYRTICGGVIMGLAQLGINARFAPINDVVADGRKLSGNAQMRKHGCILQHGTILLSVDVDEMFMLLKVPSEKLKGKLIQEAKERVSSVSQILGRDLGYEEAVPAFKAGFAQSMQMSLVDENPSDTELLRAEVLSQEKFGSPEWTNKRF